MAVGVLHGSKVQSKSKTFLFLSLAHVCTQRYLAHL